MPPPFPGQFHPPVEFLITELLYFLVIGGLCLFVYFRTREIFALSKHRGLHHFRNIFLFFSLSYLFRFLSLALLLSFDIPRYHLMRGIPFLFVGYFSTMAVLSVAMAAIPKKIRDHIDNDILLNAVSVALSIVAFLTRSNHLMLSIQTAVFAASVGIILFGRGKFISKNRITYLLLFIFWVTNMLLFGRMLRPSDGRIPVYILSALLFFWISWRVIRRLHDKEKGQA